MVAFGAARRFHLSALLLLGGLRRVCACSSRLQAFLVGFDQCGDLLGIDAGHQVLVSNGCSPEYSSRCDQSSFPRFMPKSFHRHRRECEGESA